MAGTIQTGIDLLPATGAEVKLLDGTYNIATGLVIDSYQTLKGCGRNTIFTATTADLDIITATGSSGSEKVGILLADFCVAGNAGGETNDIGIYWNYVDDSKILNCWVIDNGEDGIKIYNSDSNIINECLIADNNFEGIYVGTSNGNSIVGNVCRGNDWSIGVSSGEENAITSNVCHSNNVGIYLENSAHNSVSANTCMGNAEYGIQLTSSCDEGTVANNISEKNGYDGINVSSSDNVLIVNNTVTTNSQDADDTYDDIRLTGCSYCDVQGNLCRAGGETNKPAYAIDIESGCVGVKVINNDTYDDGFGTDVYYDGGTGTIYVEPGIDDTPVNGETGQPISSNWAYDHENAADPHPVYYTTAEVDAAIDTDIGTHEAAADPHTGYRKESDTDYIDGSHLSQDFGADSLRMYVWNFTAKQGTAYSVGNAATSPFSGDINGAPSSTEVVYDNPTNENCLKMLSIGPPTRWGRFLLHNTTRSNSRNVVAWDVDTNTITTEDTSDDWANNDVITLQSTTCTQAGYMDVDLSDELSADEVLANIIIQAVDNSAGDQATRRIIVHPFEAYDSGKRAFCNIYLASEKTAFLADIPIISQKMCVMFQNCADVGTSISFTATGEYADT